MYEFVLINLLGLLIGRKNNTAKTNNVLVARLDSTERSNRMKLNYLTTIRRQILAHSRCAALFSQI